MDRTISRESHDSKVKDLSALHVEASDDSRAAELFQLRQRYSLLADMSKERLEAVNKAVLKKLDWKFLPAVTVMLLMKYVPHPLLSTSFDMPACRMTFT